jgi:hypothetical protein
LSGLEAFGEPGQPGLLKRFDSSSVIILFDGEVSLRIPATPIYFEGSFEGMD